MSETPKFASDDYLRSLEEKLSSDPDFLRELEEPFGNLGSPAVEGPNSIPTGDKSLRSSENYATGGPPTKTISIAVEKARQEPRP